MKNSNKIILVSVVLILILASTASAATLKVGPHEKHKTIQSAVNAATDGDTIKVAYGTYKENVRIDKELTILGTKYPKVNGFYYDGGTGTISGFSIQKDGIEAWYSGGYANIIRNNYFYNCGIDLGGEITSDSIITNNQIKNGDISLYDSFDQTIKGNTFSNCKVGIYISDVVGMPTVTKNTFKHCNTAVYIYFADNPNPSRLTSFSGNKYINNKVNIKWGTKP